jgi:hypothetical protein
MMAHRLDTSGLLASLAAPRPTETELSTPLVRNDDGAILGIDWAAVFPMNPDCVNGKHHACRGDAWDLSADAPAECACDCHKEGHDA